MTTIVYDHKNKLIACDSRVTGDSIIKSDEEIKYRYCGAAIFFLAGAISDHQLLIDAYNGASVEKCESNAVFVVDGVVRFCGVDDGKFWSEELNFNNAIGSGFKFALAALDFGMDVKGAVEYAARRDFYTGGKVHVYDIASCRFLE